MRKIFRLENVRPLSAILAIALAVPVSLNLFTGFSSWLSPYIMLNSVLSLKSFVGLNVVASLILGVVLFRKRWFCRYLCPVGWGCDMVSSLNRNKRYTYKRLPDFGKLIALLSLSAAIVGFPLFIIFDPLAIFNGFFSNLSGKHGLLILIYLSGLPVLLLIHLFLPGIWCAKLCPLGGLQLLLADFKSLSAGIIVKKPRESFAVDSGRRYFLMCGTGLLAGAAIPRLLKPAVCRSIKPPGAVEPPLFNTLCCRCGNCNKSCPTGIIVPHTDFNHLLSWMTPELSFKSGYCLETCNLCSRVCPSGAITLFNVKAKSQLFIGSAEVHLSNCLIVNNKECVKCKESCKYDAVSFVSEDSILKVKPVVDVKKCVGCGACAVICPVSCIVINPIHAN
jgi:ferredoxin-type protein NapF